MPKGYWVSVYRTIAAPENLAASNTLAAPAVRARDSVAYRKALAALGDGVERDFRIVEGVG